jgi:hypothetical protein
MYVCMYVCMYVLQYVCMMYVVCMSEIIRTMGIRVLLGNYETRCVCSETKSNSCKRVCFGNPVEVIRKYLSCACIASHVCVTVVGFGFTWRQTSSLYGYGKRENAKPFVVVLESTSTRVLNSTIVPSTS